MGLLTVSYLGGNYDLLHLNYNTMCPSTPKKHFRCTRDLILDILLTAIKLKNLLSLKTDDIF